MEIIHILAIPFSETLFYQFRLLVGTDKIDS